MFRRINSWLMDGVRSLAETRSGQLPALDGLRAIAITLVIWSYARDDLVSAGGTAKPDWWFQTLDYTWVGVDLFFVLSGFLIGKILLQEIKNTGTVQIGTFLLRRGLRIWPLYYFICCVALLRMALVHTTPSLTQILPDLLFLTNFFHETLGYGTWSLSVEEQFYIVVPLFLLLVKKRMTNLGKQIPILLAFLFLIAPIIRILTWKQYISTVDAHTLEWTILHKHFYTHYDGLVIGLFLASIQVFSEQTAKIRKYLFPGFIVLGLLSFKFTLNHEPTHIYSFISLLFGTALWFCLTQPQHLFSKLLSWSPFQIVSRLSYGMYLWYRFPLWRITQAITHTFPFLPSSIHVILIFLVAFVFAVLAASLTYILIERPFLELRAHLGKKSKTGAVVLTPNL